MIGLNCRTFFIEENPEQSAGPETVYSKNTYKILQFVVANTNMGLYGSEKVYAVLLNEKTGMIHAVDLNYVEVIKDVV